MKNSEKMTNRKALDYVLENCDLPSDVSEKLSAMLVALDKKSGGTRKPTANQIANEELKAKICDSMESGVRYQVKELAKLVGMEGFQKCSALVKQSKACGKVARYEERGVAYFTKVE